MKRLLGQVLALPWRRPRTVLIAAAVATALALAAATRLHIDTSLDAMFPANDPAAAAMLHVLDQYATTDELLVLASLPADERGSDPNRLLAYAQRFQRAVAASPRASSLCQAVQYRIDPDIKRFIEQQIAPAALFYLDDASLEAARQRLSPQGMRQQLARDQALMSQPGPAAGALAKALMADPLNLHELLLPRLTAAAPFQTYGNSDALIAPDGRTILIRVIGAQPLTHLDYSVELTDVMTALARQAEPRGLSIAFTGGYAIAANSQKSIRHDAVWGVVGSVAMLLGLFAAVYRRPVRMFLLAMTPVTVGIVWGFGVYAAAQATLSPMAAVIGGVLAGMGIDYSVLYLTRYQSIRAGGVEARDAAEQTHREIGLALLAAWVTSVAGFLAIGWSTVKALRDFSILGTLGLGGSFLATLFVLPAWLTLRGGDASHSPSAFRFDLGPLLRWIGRRRIAIGSACALVGIAALAVAIWPGGGVLRPESNLMVMHPQPNPPLEAEAEFARRFGVAPGTMLIRLQAADPASLVALAYDVQRRLSSADVKAAGVSGILSVANWLPDPAVVAARSGGTNPADAQRVIADFQAATADSPFNPAAFESYGRFLAGVVHPASAPTMATLAQYPGVARNLLPRHAGGQTSESVAVVFLNHRTEDRSARDAAIDAIGLALQGVPGATLTGLPVVGHDAESALGSELSRLLLAAVTLVAGYLLLHFRRLADMLLSLLPAAVGLAILAAIVRLAGIRLNMINLVALPLLIGIDVDYGIYLVSLARRTGPALASAAQAVLVCSTSMVAGYASLALTDVPAVRSLGEVVALGVVACVFGAMFLLYPVLSSSRRSSAPAA